MYRFLLDKSNPLCYIIFMKDKSPDWFWFAKNPPKKREMRYNNEYQAICPVCLNVFHIQADCLDYTREHQGKKVVRCFDRSGYTHPWSEATMI